MEQIYKIIHQLQNSDSFSKYPWLQNLNHLSLMLVPLLFATYPYHSSVIVTLSIMHPVSPPYHHTNFELLSAQNTIHRYIDAYIHTHTKYINTYVHTKINNARILTCTHASH